ncbi:DUF3489 domain-containing protein [Sulfurivermis fontis]|uniref:DUF3489 domain-containing protein n=1 Tax=Sulfurivermis fontis TaxID=1972068 RepID=UPI000FD8DF45|nr:DUF3489 domain-containing protein [Sulfurivermis fontis]
MSTIQLTPAQHAILAYAIEHTGGKIEWFPDKLNGGARQKVLDGLASKELIANHGAGWCATAKAYRAWAESIGHPSMAAAHETPEQHEHLDAYDRAIMAAKEGAMIRKAREEAITKLKQRDSKQAKILELLERPNGATIAQICAVTGWQPHTVRATFTNVIKKKLGLNLVSERPAGGERIYRIA